MGFHSFFINLANLYQIMPENPRLLSLGMNGIPEWSQPLAGGVEVNQA
jgi:hypothetical protein